MRFVRFAGIREKKVEKSGIFYVKIEKSLGCIRHLAYFCGKIYKQNFRKLAPERPKGKALAEGIALGNYGRKPCRPVRAKALKYRANNKAFALTGRLADCHYTQGDALG